MGTNFPTNEVLSYFETGDKPTQAQFATFINGVGTIDQNSPLNNFSATTNPSSSSDSQHGYSVGSLWVNTNSGESLICVDASPNAAIWVTTQSTQPSVFPDDVFRVQNAIDDTKQMAFDVSGVTPSTTRTLTVQDVSGTVYVSGGTDVAVADGGTGISSYTTDDILYATGTTTLAKTPCTAFARTLLDDADATTARATLAAAPLDWIYKPSDTTIATNTQYTFSHGLGYVPYDFKAWLVCTTSEYAYEVGDLIPLPQAGINSSSICTISASSTDINVAFNAAIWVANENTGNSWNAFTFANWKLRVVAR